MNRVFSALCTATLFLLPATAFAASEITPPAAMTAEKGLQGTVTETMNTGGYTYLQLSKGNQSVWVAIPETKVEKGAEITCRPGMEMQNFESTTLKRTFPSIIFSPGLANAQEAPMASPHGMTATAPAKDSNFAQALQAEQQHPATEAMGVQPVGQSPGSLGAIVPSKDIVVKKASGSSSYAVGECYAKAKELDNSSVTVRGKVVKVSPKIMGKNWVHLQDGTGSPMENTHDLVLTTQELPELGEIITFSGTLHADRDFGAGYKYAVIIEDASPKK